jgi:hypothetical protein
VARWKRVWAGRRIRDGYGGSEWEDNRLFIKDGDHSRIFVADNSGTNPGNTEEGPTEIDLTHPGWLSERTPYPPDKGWRERCPYGVNAHTMCDRHVSIAFEAALFLHEQYGFQIESNLSKVLFNRLNALGRVLRLTTLRPLEKLAEQAE